MDVLIVAVPETAGSALYGMVDIHLAAGNIWQTLKRRFVTASGNTLIGRLQNLRMEAAKRLLETTRMPVEEISTEVGYEDASFFRRLFKRSTGLTPGQYRRMFQPVFGA